MLLGSELDFVEPGGASDVEALFRFPLDSAVRGALCPRAGSTGTPAPVKGTLGARGLNSFGAVGSDGTVAREGRRGVSEEDEVSDIGIPCRRTVIVSPSRITSILCEGGK